MKHKVSNKERIILIIVFTIIYVLLGNARSVQPNPFIDGAVIAFNMIIPIVAGTVGGARAGAIVGFCGTTLESITPAGSIFTVLAIIPHTIMGGLAGWLKKRYHVHTVPLALIAGHLFNISLYLLFGLISITTIQNIDFWIGILFEIIVGSIGVIIIFFIYRIGFTKDHDTT